jgi:hypothetical protein
MRASLVCAAWRRERAARGDSGKQQPQRPSRRLRVAGGLSVDGTVAQRANARKPRPHQAKLKGRRGLCLRRGWGPLPRLSLRRGCVLGREGGSGQTLKSDPSS